MMKKMMWLNMFLIIWVVYFSDLDTCDETNDSNIFHLIHSDIVKIIDNTCPYTNLDLTMFSKFNYPKFESSRTCQ